MFVSSKDLTRAMKQISAVANMDKKKPGILFDIRDNELEIYYATRLSAISVTIDAVVGKDEFHGKAIFDYNQLADLSEAFVASGRIVLRSIEINFTINPDGRGTAHFIVNKQMKTIGADGEEVYTTMSLNTYDAGFTTEDKATMLSKILTTRPCEDMFLEAGAYSLSVAEFNSLVRRASTGDARVIYMLPSHNGVFAMNTNNLLYTRSEESIEQAANMSTVSMKAISSALSYIDKSYLLEDIEDINEKVSSVASNIKTDTELDVFGSQGTEESDMTNNLADALEAVKSATNDSSNVVDEDVSINFNTLNADNGKAIAYLIYTDDKRFGVYMAAVDKVAAHGAEISRYLAPKYDTFNFTVNTDILVDTLKSVVNMQASDEAEIEFYKEGTSINAKINVVDTGKSINNNYNIVCSSFNTRNEVADGTIVKVKFNKKQILSIVKNNKNDYTAFDIFVTESGKMLVRVGFINNNLAAEVSTKYAEENGIQPNELSVDDKLTIRGNYLETCYYMATKS